MPLVGRKLHSVAVHVGQQGAQEAAMGLRRGWREGSRCFAWGRWRRVGIGFPGHRRGKLDAMVSSGGLKGGAVVRGKDQGIDQQRGATTTLNK